VDFLDGIEAHIQSEKHIKETSEIGHRLLELNEEEKVTWFRLVSCHCLGGFKKRSRAEARRRSSGHFCADLEVGFLM